MKNSASDAKNPEDLQYVSNEIQWLLSDDAQRYIDSFIRQLLEKQVKKGKTENEAIDILIKHYKAELKSTKQSANEIVTELKLEGRVEQESRIELFWYNFLQQLLYKLNNLRGNPYPKIYLNRDSPTARAFAELLTQLHTL